ncbi:unannotated protein [freshwater metagenome]|uniref:Unannotated protein n=1 Tax=freshwater metagenome TaxID=449393 RepID=A0A6J7DYF2_9ZZZZ|nr:Hsp20 family protein [Actinomycetota bacterium]
MSTLVKHTTPMPLAEWATRDLPEFFRGWDWTDVGTWFDRDSLRLEEFREDGAMIVRAEIPGIDPDKDVEITVSEGALCLRVERRSETEDSGKGFYRSEFHYGQFTRRIPLPAGTTEKQISASYTDGILEIKLPITQTHNGATKIEVLRK